VRGLLLDRLQTLNLLPGKLPVMDAESAKNRPDSWPRQEEMELDVAPEPGNIVLLRNLVEIHDLWGKDAKSVYRAVRHGRLHAYGRPGHQRYYSHAELVVAFGAPTNDRPPLSRRNRGRLNGEDRTGGQLRFDELDNAAAAA
jgi:hypothetical protein